MKLIETYRKLLASLAKFIAVNFYQFRNRRLHVSINFNFVKKNGFTLIELIVVIGIVALLTVLILPNYGQGREQFALQRSAHKLAQDLRQAQEMAMSAKKFHDLIPPGGYGIYFDKTNLPQSYILFADCDGDKEYDLTGNPCNGYSEKVSEQELEKKVKIKNLTASPLNIVFTPPDPEVFINQTFSLGVITLTNDGQTKTVTVNKAGLISIE